MQQNPYQDIAKEFLDIWQKQMASTMGDKQFIQAMMDMFSNMQPNANHATKSTTSANATHASDAQHGVVAELAFRLAMCEKRIAALESQLAAIHKPAAANSGKRPAARGKKPRD